MMRIFPRVSHNTRRLVLMPMQEGIAKVEREQVPYVVVKPRKRFQCVIGWRTRRYLLIVVKATRLQWAERVGGEEMENEWRRHFQAAWSGRGGETEGRSCKPV